MGINALINYVEIDYSPHTCATVVASAPQKNGRRRNDSSLSVVACAIKRSWILEFLRVR